MRISGPSSGRWPAWGWHSQRRWGKGGWVPRFQGRPGTGDGPRMKSVFDLVEAPTLQHKLLVLSCLLPPCSARVSQGREEVFLAPSLGLAKPLQSPHPAFTYSCLSKMFPSGLDFPRLHLCSVSLWITGKETLLKRVKYFWAGLQQLKWTNVVCKGGVEGEHLWGGAGACWAQNLGKGDEKAAQASWLSSFLSSCLPCLSSYWQSKLLRCWMNGKAPIGIDSGPKFWALWGHPEPTAKFSRAL